MGGIAPDHWQNREFYFAWMRIILIRKVDGVETFSSNVSNIYLWKSSYIYNDFYILIFLKHAITKEKNDGETNNEYFWHVMLYLRLQDNRSAASGYQFNELVFFFKQLDIIQVFFYRWRVMYFIVKMEDFFIRFKQDNL